MKKVNTTVFQTELVIEKYPTTLPVTAITSSLKASQFLRLVWDTKSIEIRESFYAMFLGGENKVIGYALIGIGTSSRCLVDLKTIFTHGLRCGAKGIIIAHNHPGGVAKPSFSDKDLTTKACDVSKLLDMPIIEHIILTHDDYYSFADDGLI